MPLNYHDEYVNIVRNDNKLKRQIANARNDDTIT